jgi:hypothetical protein
MRDDWSKILASHSVAHEEFGLLEYTPLSDPPTLVFRKARVSESLVHM